MKNRILLIVTAVQAVALSFLLGSMTSRSGAAAPEPMPVASLALAGEVSAANAQDQPIMPAILGVSLAEARVVIDATVAYAKAINGTAGVAVLDGAGNIISLDRMDGSSYQQDRQAAGKARIAVQLRQRSSATTRVMETTPERFYSVLSMFPGEIFWQAGGVPFAVEGRLVGAVGVSGLTGGQDEPAADAGIDAWRRYRQSMAN